MQCFSPLSSEIRKLLDKQYTLVAGPKNPNISFNRNHAIDDYSNVLEMLYFDPSVQNLLKKKTDKKYRRKMNNEDKYIITSNQIVVSA